MDFDDHPPRRQAEPFVPMINVVFLLLIFFLMTAQIAPPEPFEVTPPRAEDGAASDGAAYLHVSKDGELAHQELRGEAAVLAAIADAEPSGRPVSLRADAEMEASALAATLKMLAANGAGSVELVTAPR